MVPLIPPNEAQLKNIYDNIQLNPEQLDKDIKTLREWLKMQPHLPQDALDDTMLTSFITGCKNSLQRAKQSIDRYLTNRSSFPDIYANRNPVSEEFAQSIATVRFFPLPEMTPEGYRVIISSIINSDPDAFHYTTFIKRTLCCGDIVIQSEHSIGGVYYVYDLKGLSLMHLAKLSPSQSKRFIYCGEDSMPIRTKGSFLINAPSITETLVNMFKPILKEKTAKRIHVCSGDHTSLYKYIPQDILPNEYGGKAGSLDDLHRSWNEYLYSFRDWFLEDGKRTVDESKRPEKCIYKPQQLFGIEGSFKTLSID